MQGSVFWMAPEMLHSNNQGYSAKVDIWSVGCVVLEMQSERRPWTEEDVFAVMYKVLLMHFLRDDVLISHVLGWQSATSTPSSRRRTLDPTC
jgi:serine/threonine protein kinase